MRFVVGAAILLGVCLLLYFYYLHSPVPRLPTLSAEPVARLLQVGTRTRRYLLYVPQGLPPHAPLLLVLHGSRQDGARMRAWTGYAFDRLADRDGFAVVYADGYKGGWNDCRRHGGTPAKDEDVDDVTFLRALVTQIAKELSTDLTRVVAMGYSNGGQMGFRMLAEAPGLLSGLAVAGASLPVPAARSCKIALDVPLLMVNGTADPIVPYAGGEVSLFGISKRGRALPAFESAEEFAHLADAQAGPIDFLPPQLPGDRTSAERHTWERGGQAKVVLITIRGGGHVVPQSAFRYPRMLGPTSSALDMPAEVVRFFDLTRTASNKT